MIALYFIYTCSTYYNVSVKCNYSNFFYNLAQEIKDAKHEEAILMYNNLIKIISSGKYTICYCTKNINKFLFKDCQLLILKSFKNFCNASYF